MQKRKKAFVPLIAAALTMYVCFYSTTVSAAPMLLKQGMSGSEISQLQKNLKSLGYFSSQPTGYYGTITVASVKRLQARYGLVQDGAAGKNTLALVSKLLGQTGAAAPAASKLAAAKAIVSRGDTGGGNYLLSWTGGASKVFAIGKVAQVYDIDSGLSFNVKRTYGYNHADCEPLTSEDTATLKKIYGGQWSWNRRAIIVTVDGRKIAASMAGMPHAGVDEQPENKYVSSRSGGYGGGANLDDVKGNGMDGHFDIHFLGSKTHGTNRIDSAHQKMVQKAAEWAKENL